MYPLEGDAVPLEEARERQREAPPDLSGYAMDWATLADKTPPPRRWAWEPWIPAGTVTLLHGFGGIGKTLLAQQLATAYALGKPLFGGATAGGKALLLAGEDDHDELWRRQVDICQRFEVDISNCAETLDILPMPHVDITIAAADSASSRILTTPMLQAMRDRIDDIRPGLVILDNSAKLFGFSENDRALVTRGIRLLQAICHDFDATLVLLAHNNKAGDASGSTAWENAVRSRLSMTRDPEDKETVILARPKANYASNGDIAIRWHRGSFRAESAGAQSLVDRIEADNRAKAAEKALLSFIERRNAQGRPVSDSRQAQTFVVKEMDQDSKGAMNGHTAKDIEKALRRLLDQGDLLSGQQICQGANRHWKTGLAQPQARDGQAA